MKPIKLLLLALGIAAVGAAVWLAGDMYRYANRPAGSDDAQMVVSIPVGENLDSLAARLESKGILNSTVRFKLLARLRQDDKHLKAGEYKLSSTMTPTQILDVLVRGKIYLHVLTIPEGYTLKQIADEVGRLGLADKETFIADATDKTVVASFGLEGDTLEGYLFPDTYHFPKGNKPIAIITKMVERFKEQFIAQWHERAKELGMTVFQVVTLASMIEKETGAPFERPLISSVFHNRLKKKMRLASDPTVIYGIKDFDGNIKRRHLTTRTPYNTYMIKGLPAGPIANPGRAAIEAALFPAETDYLYFVSKKDNTHYFSTNIKEHNKAVRRYQLRHRR